MAKKRSRKKSGGKSAGKSAGKSPAAATEVPSAKIQHAPLREKRPAAPKLTRDKRKLPNWPVLVPALAGVLLAGFLTASTWSGEELPYCTTGSDCDIVQSSRWADFLGLPVAAWGFLAYLSLAWVAFRVRSVEWHWKLSWTLTLTGLAISVYLTVISIVELEAACTYCLVSLGIMGLLFGIVAYQSPKGLSEFTWPGWLLQTGGLAAALIVAVHLYWSGVFDPARGEEDPYLKDLAIHLDDSGAQFFGAFWCPNCDRQKEAFTASAYRLPYIECSPSGRNGPPAPICSINGISAFPTWVIRDRRHEGFLSIKELARRSGFSPPPDENTR